MSEDQQENGSSEQSLSRNEAEVPEIELIIKVSFILFIRKTLLLFTRKLSNI
jgi:hypothetical protein